MKVAIVSVLLSILGLVTSIRYGWGALACVVVGYILGAVIVLK